MNIQDRITEIENNNKFLLLRKTEEKAKVDKYIITLDYWLSRRKQGKDIAKLYTERYVITGFATPQERIYLDETNLKNVVRMKKW